MNNEISYSQVLDRLTEQNIPHAILKLQNDVRIVISQHGGRILGPFLTSKSESLSWLSAAFSDSGEFDRFLKSGDWNIGGDRIWIGPEIQYSVIDRGNERGTAKETVQTQMDPGNPSLTQTVLGSWRLHQSMTLDAFTLTTGKKTLSLDRTIRMAQNPLRDFCNFQKLMNGVLFAGYAQKINLTEEKADDIVSNVWSLIQLNPEGVVLTSTYSDADYIDYYEPVDDSVHSISSNHAMAHINGNRQYKVGYLATNVMGRIAYLSRLTNSKWYLIIRNFFNNPSAFYPDEPAHLPGVNGASVFIYNDDGGLGGFGEMEFQGQAIGGLTGQSSTYEEISTWIFVGGKDKLEMISNQLLGLDL